MKMQCLRIGQVAVQAGVHIQTLRYYERRGLLEEPERTRSGYREYPPETVRIIRFVKRAQDLGFTLGEVGDLLALRKRPRDRRKVRAAAEAKLRDIDDKVRRLQSMRRALTTLVESCACSGAEVTCPIIEALDDGGLPGDLVELGPARTEGGADAD